MTPPNRQSVAGQVYLDLRRLATTTGRATDELLQLYALEGFLDRLTRSDQRDHFVLKGGVLLSAYDARRATRDIDFAARAPANDIDTMIETIRAIIDVHLDDGRWPGEGAHHHTILRSNFDVLTSPRDLLIAAQPLQRDFAHHRGHDSEPAVEPAIRYSEPRRRRLTC